MIEFVLVFNISYPHKKWIKDQLIELLILWYKYLKKIKIVINVVARVQKYSEF